MSKETTQAFWDAWEAWVRSCDSNTKTTVYRLYYDEQGAPVRYTTESLPGDWIPISVEMFAMSPVNVRVIQGNLQMLDTASLVTKLYPGDMGTACDPRDVCVTIDDNQRHRRWHKKWKT